MLNNKLFVKLENGKKLYECNTGVETLRKYIPLDQGCFAAIADDIYKRYGKIRSAVKIQIMEDMTTPIGSDILDQRFCNVSQQLTEDGKHLVYNSQRLRVEKLSASRTDSPIYRIVNSNNIIAAKGTMTLRDFITNRYGGVGRKRKRGESSIDKKAFRGREFERNIPLQQLIDEAMDFSSPLHKKPAHYYLDLRFVTSEADNLFNLDNLPSSLGGHLPNRPVDENRIIGVQTSVFYVGSAGSCTGLHPEDYKFASLNYMPIIEGMSENYGLKIWVAVRPGQEKDLARKLFEAGLVISSEQQAPCLNIFHEKSHLLSCEWMLDNEVWFDVFFQRPGQMMMTFFKGLHQVINATVTLCESTNFSLPCHRDVVGSDPYECQCLGESCAWMTDEKRKINWEIPKEEQAAANSSLPPSMSVQAIPRVSCDKCDKSFSTPKHLQRHLKVSCQLKTHVPSETVNCSICFKVVKGNWLKRHQRTKLCMKIKRDRQLEVSRQKKMEKTVGGCKSKNNVNKISVAKEKNETN